MSMKRPQHLYDDPMQVYAEMVRLYDPKWMNGYDFLRGQTPKPLRGGDMDHYDITTGGETDSELSMSGSSPTIRANVVPKKPYTIPRIVPTTSVLLKDRKKKVR